MKRRIAEALAIVVLALAAVACGESPPEGYAKIIAMARKGDWGGVYDRVDKRSQGLMEANLERYSSNPRESHRDTFTHAARTEDLARRFSDEYEVDGYEVEGDKAALLLRVKRPDGHVSEVSMDLVREDGVWKVTHSAVDLPPPSDPPTDPADHVRAVECARLVDAFARGRAAIKARRDGKDPVATLGAMASDLEASAVETAKLEIATPELQTWAKEYQDMARAVAQAARDMASASRGGDDARAQAAMGAYEAAARREPPMFDGVRRACARR